MTEWIFVYALSSAALALISFLVCVSEELPSGFPKNALPALALLVGLVWPLAITLALLWGVWPAAVGMGRSFVALWRYVRPARREIPRAKVVHRGEP